MSVSKGIEEAGKVCTLIRTPTNKSTYLWIPASRQKQFDPYLDHIITAWLPIESAIVAGELLLCGGDYHLVMTVSKEAQFGEDTHFRIVLYKCNSTVSILYYNDATKKFDTVHASNIHCLITQSISREWDEDKTMAVRSYRGRTQPFQLFMRSTEGLTTKSVIVDQAGRRFRVGKDFDLFVENGIVQTEVEWER